MHSGTSASFGTELSYDVGAISLSEVISAMTFALDLTEGAVPGHGLRTCLLAMRLGKAIGLSTDQRNNLYYATLLKDIGCSSNAARMHEIVGGDDRAVKAAAKLADWTRPQRADLRTITSIWQNVTPQKGIPRRVGRMMQMALHQNRNNREMIALRCERGDDIVRNLEMGEEVGSAVKRLDEHWDGSGYPDGLCGQEIPLLARLCLIAQTLDVFGIVDGQDAAVELLRARKGTWFDPELVTVAGRLHDCGELWGEWSPEISVEETRRAVLDLDPRMMADLVPDRVDHLCTALAGVVDAKSPFTYRHSVGVADVAVETATEMGLSVERVQLVRRAALLHDIGKLRVPNTILEKAGKLTPEEWSVVREHPGLSRSILKRVSSFRELAAMAGEHHEKLDGSGYPWGLKAEDLSVESRLLAVADVFAALAEDRPYRPGLDLKAIRRIMAQEVPVQLDGGCYEALLAAAARWPDNRPRANPIQSVAAGNAISWRAADEDVALTG